MLPFNRLLKSNTIDNLWIYILTLAVDGPIYAYYFQRDIKKRFGFCIGKITSYRVLYRLEQGGFVKSEIKDRKRIYRITQKGRKELDRAKKFYEEMLKLMRKI